MDHRSHTLTVEMLVTEYYEAVYRFAYRLSGSTVDADDLTQQSFLVACRKLEGLRDPERARSWLFTIVRNLYLKSRRPVDQVMTSLSDAAEPAADWDWGSAIDSERLQQALNALPETYRTPLLLYYFEDLPYREIAEILNTPIGTVMSRLSRGKEFLRTTLNSPEEVGLMSDSSHT